MSTRDPFLHAAIERGIYQRQRSHAGPALTVYPRKPTSGWVWLALGLALAALGAMAGMVVL